MPKMSIIKWEGGLDMAYCTGCGKEATEWAVFEEGPEGPELPFCEHCYEWLKLIRDCRKNGDLELLKMIMGQLSQNGTENGGE